MRTLTDTQTRLYATTTRSAWVQVQVEDGDGSFQDLTSFLGYNWIVSVEWGEDIDQNAADATVVLRADVGRISLVPTMTTSRANVSTSGDPLLALHRRIKISANVGRDRVDPGTYVLLFDGRITDLGLGGAGEEITLTCVDRFNELVNYWIETPATYSNSGGTAVQTVMQSILTDNGGLFTLYTPASPSWNVTTFQTETQSLADELTMLADQIGWSLRWKWDSGTSAFRLTFFEFDRATTTSLFTLSNGYYYRVASDDLSEADIRNVVEVTYSDPADLDADGAPTRKTHTESDATSIAKYGRRWMSICEAATSNIDTATEATTLAENVLADLKDPVGIVTVDAPFLHFVELGDVYTLGADSIRFDTDQTISVQGYRHRIDADTARTSITARLATAAGGSRRWLQMAGAPGVGELADTVGPPAPSLTAQNANGSVMVDFVASRRPGLVYEVHTGPVGFTPDLTDGSITLRHRGIPRSRVGTDPTYVPIGELIDIVGIAVDERGNRSSQTRSSSKQALRTGPQWLDPAARVSPGFPGGVFGMQTRGTTYPPDGWSMSVGTWATDADLDTSGTYTAPKTGTYALTLVNTATATKLVSDKFPVTVGRSYRVQAEVKASNNTNTITVAIDWLDSASSVLSTFTIKASAAAAANTWEPVAAMASPPTSARYARVTVAKSANAFYVAFDRVIFEECPAVDDEMHGIDIFDDFTDADTSARWTMTQLGADSATNPTIPSKVASATGGYTWGERGIVRFTTPAVTDYGAVASLADTPFYGLPPVGVTFKIKVRLPNTTTNVTFWAGLFDDATTFPDSALTNSIHGVGIRSAAAGGTATWKAISRDGTNETSVNFAVNADSSWVVIGFRRTASGIQPVLGDHDFGSEITTNIPAATTFGLLWGVYTTNAVAKDGDVDLVQLAGRFPRYDS